ncbi:hypothetical protein KR222_010578, partial [Zaprionus bogoriensis]
KAIRSCFLRNKDPHFQGISLPVSRKFYYKLESLLETLTTALQKHVVLKSAIRRIFRIDGTVIDDIDDILEGDIIVCCCQYEAFVDVGYNVNRNYMKLLKTIVRLRAKFQGSRQPNNRTSLQQMEISDLPKSISLYINVTCLMFYNKSSAIFEGYGRANHKKLCIVKVVDKEQMSEFSEEPYLEIEILRHLQRHPNIIDLFYTVEQPKYVFIVIERMNCDLVEFMSYCPVIPESDVKLIMSDVAKGLEYMHEKHIIHRDIKLNNLLVELEEGPARHGLAVRVVKIVDFGLATYCDGKRLVYQCCGTPHYMAPEIINNSGYDFRADCWAFGITLYNLLFRSFPFGHDYRDKKDVWRCIQKKTFRIPFDLAGQISGEAKLLLHSLLDKSLRNRLTSTQIRRHPFLRK